MGPIHRSISTSFNGADLGIGSPRLGWEGQAWGLLFPPLFGTMDTRENYAYKQTSHGGRKSCHANW